MEPLILMNALHALFVGLVLLGSYQLVLTLRAKKQVKNDGHTDEIYEEDED